VREFQGLVDRSHVPILEQTPERCSEEDVDTSTFYVHVYGDCLLLGLLLPLCRERYMHCNDAVLTEQGVKGAFGVK